MLRLNIEQRTKHNNHWRKVLSTTPQMQLVLMHIPAGEEIDSEIHPHTTQFIRVEQGNGVAYVNGQQYRLSADIALVIPPGAEHRIKSTNKALKLYTIYSPPEHAPNTLQHCKPT